MLGNKIEMEITQLVEQNPTLLRLGLHLEFNDARHRVAAHLQRNIDRSEYKYSIREKYSLREIFDSDHRIVKKLSKIYRNVQDSEQTFVYPRKIRKTFLMFLG